jgi:hypothetical protein
MLSPEQQHAFVILARLAPYSGSHYRLDPSIKILIECHLFSFQVTAQVAFSQLPGKVGLRFPHRAGTSWSESPVVWFPRH